MSGKEIPRRHLSEDESELRQEEIGPLAYQLIGEFKEAIKCVSAFAQALQALYFAEAQHDEYSMFKSQKPFDQPITFAYRSYRYSVIYSTESERVELRVSKAPIHKDSQGYWSEDVKLEAHVNRLDRSFDGGGIQHARFSRDLPADYPTNTPTAVQRVRDFLRDNFPTQ